MGRPSKLTDAQWNTIKNRLLRGELKSALAKEYGVGVTTVSDKFPGSLSEIKDVANQMVRAEEAFLALPYNDRVSVLSLTDDLKAISSNLALAAKFSSATAHRLAGIAHAKTQDITPDNAWSPDSMESLKGIAVMTRMANDSSQIGVSLLNANKEAVKIINTVPVGSLARTIDPRKLSDAAIKELLAARDTAE